MRLELDPTRDPRSQGDGLSDNEDLCSEWDTMSIVETFGRGVMLYDYKVCEDHKILSHS